MPNKDTTILERQTSRREVIRKAAYMTPVILTLTAVPSFAAKGSGAARGSGEDTPNGVERKWDTAEGSSWWDELLRSLFRTGGQRHRKPDRTSHGNAPS